MSTTSPSLARFFMIHIGISVNLMNGNLSVASIRMRENLSRNLSEIHLWVDLERFQLKIASSYPPICPELVWIAPYMMFFLKMRNLLRRKGLKRPIVRPRLRNMRNPLARIHQRPGLPLIILLKLHQINDFHDMSWKKELLKNIVFIWHFWCNPSKVWNISISMRFYWYELNKSYIWMRYQVKISLIIDVTSRTNYPHNLYYWIA